MAEETKSTTPPPPPPPSQDVKPMPTVQVSTHSDNRPTSYQLVIGNTRGNSNKNE